MKVCSVSRLESVYQAQCGESVKFGEQCSFSGVDMSVAGSFAKTSVAAPEI